MISVQMYNKFLIKKNIKFIVKQFFNKKDGKVLQIAEEFVPLHSLKSAMPL